MADQSLQLRLTQKLALSPQLQQAIRLLQLNRIELREYIQEVLDQNPILEREEAADSEPPEVDGAEAAEDFDDGRTLYERLSTLAEHFSNVGGSLGRAVVAYNKAVGSLETRVLVTARQFTDLGAAPEGELPEVASVDETTRRLDAPELTPDAADDPDRT